MKCTSLFLSVILLLVSQSLYPQQVTISRIVDSNLFELSDSTLIKLAGVDMPKTNNPHYFLRETAREAIHFSEDNLLNRTFKLKYLSENEDYKLVLLLRSYIIGEEAINHLFLEKGYGKFINNADSLDITTLITAQDKAKAERIGIWRILELNYSDVLDRDGEFDAIQSPPADSIRFQSISYPVATPGKVIAELLVSPFGGFITSIFTVGVTSYFFSKAKDETEFKHILLLSFFSGYSLGTAATVYLIDKNSSKDVTFANTLIASAIGAGLGGGLVALITKNSNIQSEFFIATMIKATIAPVIYVNAIAPDRFSGSISAAYELRLKGLNAAELYNRTLLANFELFRINF